MKYEILKIICLLSAFHFSSCTDILLKDLDGEQVTILSPRDSLRTASNSVTFWWELKEGAESYRLQIVSPKFDSLITFLHDSPVVGDKFFRTFNTGTYEWRIRPENSVSVGDYVTRTLFVVTNDSLDQQQMFLLNPADNFITNQSSVSFNWYGISAATDYKFELLNVGTSQLVIPAQLVTDTFLNLTVEEGTFDWQVRAENEFSVTPFTSRSLTIDTTRPEKPTLITPLNNETISGTADFEWSRGTNSGTAIFDSLFIYSDSLNTIFSIDTTGNTTFSDSLPVGDYYWRVRSVDAATNMSEVSNSRRFLIQ